MPVAKLHQVFTVACTNTIVNVNVMFHLHLSFILHNLYLKAVINNSVYSKNDADYKFDRNINCLGMSSHILYKKN
jgi:hypothetical protein